MQKPRQIIARKFGKIIPPLFYRMDLVITFYNGYPEFDLVPCGSSDEKIIWTGPVKIPVQVYDLKLLQKESKK